MAFFPSEYRKRDSLSFNTHSGKLIIIKNLSPNSALSLVFFFLVIFWVPQFPLLPIKVWICPTCFRGFGLFILLNKYKWTLESVMFYIHQGNASEDKINQLCEILVFSVQSLIHSTSYLLRAYSMSGRLLSTYLQKGFIPPIFTLTDLPTNWHDTPLRIKSLLEVFNFKWHLLSIPYGYWFHFQYFL